MTFFTKSIKVRCPECGKEWFTFRADDYCPDCGRYIDNLESCTIGVGTAADVMSQNLSPRII